MKRLFVVSLLDMTTTEKDGGIVILPMDDATKHEIWCLMKYLLGGS